MLTKVILCAFICQLSLASDTTSLKASPDDDVDPEPPAEPPQSLVDPILPPVDPVARVDPLPSVNLLPSVEIVPPVAFGAFGENLNRYLCLDPQGCMGHTKTIINPSNGFKFICGDQQSCQDAAFTISLNDDITKPGPITQFETLILDGLNSGKGATFTFDNQQGVDPFTKIPSMLELERVECNGYGSCDGMTIITGQNIFIDEIICAHQACYDCTVKVNPMDAGKPCDPTQIQRSISMSRVPIIVPASNSGSAQATPQGADPIPPQQPQHAVPAAFGRRLALLTNYTNGTSAVPSTASTLEPTQPTNAPTVSPTPYPTISPTSSPTFSPTLSPTLSPTPSLTHIWMTIGFCDNFRASDSNDPYASWKDSTIYDNYDLGVAFLGKTTSTPFVLTGGEHCYQHSSSVNCFFHSTDYIGDFVKLTVEPSYDTLWCINNITIRIADVIVAYDKDNCPFPTDNACTEWEKYSKSLMADYYRNEYIVIDLSEQINEGIILTSNCEQSFYDRDDGIFIQCFDNVFEIYRYVSRKQIGIEMHSCALPDSGMYATSLDHLYLDIIGKERSDKKTNTDWTSLEAPISLSHFPRTILQSGIVHWENIGDHLGSNVFVPGDPIGWAEGFAFAFMGRLYADGLEGILVGIRYNIQQVTYSNDEQYTASTLKSGEAGMLPLFICGGLVFNHKDIINDPISSAIVSDTDHSVCIHLVKSRENDERFVYIEPNDILEFDHTWDSNTFSNMQADIHVIMRHCRWDFANGIGLDIENEFHEKIECFDTLSEAKRLCAKMESACFGINFEEETAGNHRYCARRPAELVAELKQQESVESSWIKMCDALNYEMPYTSIGTGLTCTRCVRIAGYKTVKTHTAKIVGAFLGPFAFLGVGIGAIIDETGVTGKKAAIYESGTDGIIGKGWYETNEDCKRYFSGSLASIHSLDQAIIANMVKMKDESWIGLNSRHFPMANADGKAWNDGTVNDKKGYNDPEDIHKDCVALSTGFVNFGAKTTGYDCDDYSANIQEGICTSYGWPTDEYRTFIINTQQQINEISMISLLVDSSQNDSICIDQVTLITETKYNEKGSSSSIPQSWIGNKQNCAKCENAAYMFLKDAVCDIEVVDVSFDLDNQIITDEQEVLSGFECKNSNRFQESECGVERSVEFTDETSISISHSKETGWTKSEGGSIAATIGAEIGSEAVGIKAIVSATGTGEWNKENSESFTDATEDGVSRGSSSSVSCSASISVGKGHKQSYSLILTHTNVTIATFQDLKLTLCSKYYGDTDSNQVHEKFIDNVPGRIVHTTTTSCIVAFASPQYIRNDIKCNEEQQLAFLEQDIWIPLCNQHEPEMYDGCQCVIGDKLTESACTCSDTSGNPLTDGKAIVVDSTIGWENTCRLMNCANSIYSNQDIVIANVDGTSSNILNGIVEAKQFQDKKIIHDNTVHDNVNHNNWNNSYLIAFGLIIIAISICFVGIVYIFVHIFSNKNQYNKISVSDSEIEV